MLLPRVGLAAIPISLRFTTFDSLLASAALLHVLSYLFVFVSCHAIPFSLRIDIV